MGADLSIVKFKPTYVVGAFEASKKAVEEGGYFRDCYNSGGLFSILRCNTSQNLSWWDFTDEAKKNGWHNKKNCNMKVVGLKMLLERVQKAVEEFKSMKPSAIRYREIAIDKKGNFKKNKNGSFVYDFHKFKNSKAQYSQYLEWGNNLITFLNKAIELKSPVVWSV